MYADDLVRAAAAGDDDDEYTMLIAVGRPLGFLDASRTRYGIEFYGRALEVESALAAAWLAIRTFRWE